MIKSITIITLLFSFSLYASEDMIQCVERYDQCMIECREIDGCMIEAQECVDKCRDNRYQCVENSIDEE